MPAERESTDVDGAADAQDTSGGEKGIGRMWVVHRVPPQRSRETTVRLALCPRARRSDLTELSSGERRELADLLGPLVSTVKSVLDTERVTVIHLSDVGEPQVRVELIADPGPNAHRSDAPVLSVIVAKATALIVSSTTDRTAVVAGYSFVESVLAGLATIQRMSLYGPIVRAWARNDDTNRRRAQVAPAYTLGWLFLAALILLVSSVWASATLPALLAVAIATYRFVDIVSFHVRLLLSRHPDQTTVASLDRSLILLTCNVVELSVLSGIWLRAAGVASSTGAWFSGFLLTTLVSTPKGQYVSSTAGTEIDLATVATICGALILLIGGAALLIGLIGQRFREHAE